MARERLSLEYHGPEVEGRVDARDLASSLLAFSDVVRISQAVLYPNDSPVHLEVVADRSGSYIVDIEVVHTLVEHVWSLLSGDDASAAANLATLAGTTVALMAFLVRAGIKRIVQRNSVSPGVTKVTFADGTEVEVANEVLKLNDHLSVRRSIRDMVSPVDEGRVETVRVRHREDLVEITATDIPALDPPEDVPEVIEQFRREAVLKIASVAFTEGNKWRLTDADGRTFYASIDDPAFVERVQNAQERFSAGDTLHVQLLSREVETQASGRHFEHAVTEVLLHLPAQPWQEGPMPGLEGENE